jgi:hypothetical protein
MKKVNFLRTLVAGAIILAGSFQVFAQADANSLYVSPAGSNSNDGSKSSPVKNIQKAIDIAKDGQTIIVAEGNYFGTLNKGTINITKPVKIYGGYNADFSQRNVLKFLTMCKPSVESNGTQNGQGTVQIQVKNGGEVVIDGIIFDRGNTIAYCPKGKGKPEGVDCPMMHEPIGQGGIGGENLTDNLSTVQTAQIYLDNTTCELTIRNCAFLNAPNYAIRGMFGGKKGLITNCIFINNRMAAVEITKGGLDAQLTELEFCYNTVLFMWTRTKEMEDMGYGFRYMTRINNNVHHNILGMTLFGGIDHTRIDSDKNREAQRISIAEHNIFMLNKQGDLCIPGGGKWQFVNAGDFGDVEQLNKSAGNKTLTDPAAFKGKINQAYLEGFLSANYSETSDYNPNSPANQFRSAMGMNKTGTTQSKVTMWANRYPWKEALLLFGAMNGYGAQTIK